MRIALIVLGIAIVAGSAFFLLRKPTTIEYQGRRIPLEQLRTTDPHPGCEGTHYHAATGGSVTTIEGTVVPDDTDCGFGSAK